MGYDNALAKLRDRAVATPGFEDVEERSRIAAAQRHPPMRLRWSAVATVVAIVAYGALLVGPAYELTSYLPWIVALFSSWIAVLLPAGLLGWSLRLVRRAGVGPQILARAILWSNLVVGVLLSGNMPWLRYRVLGSVVAVACAVALILLGSRGMAKPSPGDAFAPIRFRTHLLLALVMAFADAQTLLFSALMQLRIGVSAWTLRATILYAGPTVLAAAVMVLAVWGLYRLRTWALLLNIVANVAIAKLGLDGDLNLAFPVAGALAATAAVQLLLPVPILAAALGDKRAGQPVFGRFGPALLRVALLGLASAALVLPAMVDRPQGWLTGAPRAFTRGLGPVAPRRGAPPPPKLVPKPQPARR